MISATADSAKEIQAPSVTSPARRRRFRWRLRVITRGSSRGAPGAAAGPRVRGIGTRSQVREHAVAEQGHRVQPRLARLPLVADEQKPAEAADVALEVLELLRHLVGIADDPDIVEEVLGSDPVVGHVRVDLAE